MREDTHPNQGGANDPGQVPSGALVEDGEEPAAPKGAPNPRDAIIDRMAAQADEDRIAKLAEQGLSSREQMHQEPASKKDVLADPLADFLVVHEGKTFMRTKVDGQERLVPLDRVRATIQKDEAAEGRLQRAAEWQKELAAREKQIVEREGQLAQRARQPVQPPAPRVADADDPDLLREIQSVVSNLFEGDEKSAVKQLAKVIANAKASAAVAAQTPSIDVHQIAREAATAARAQMKQEARDEDMMKGYQAFKSDFPELMADPILFAAVDKVTEELEEKHPKWAPSQIMQEAGTQVRTWHRSQTQPRTPETDPANDRLNAKRNLVPMPKAREGAPPRQEPEREQTPAESLAEIRRQRGLPV